MKHSPCNVCGVCVNVSIFICFSWLLFYFCSLLISSGLCKTEVECGSFTCHMCLREAVRLQAGCSGAIGSALGSISVWFLYLCESLTQRTASVSSFHGFCQTCKSCQRRQLGSRPRPDVVSFNQTNWKGVFQFLLMASFFFSFFFRLHELLATFRPGTLSAFLWNFLVYLLLWSLICYFDRAWVVYKATINVYLM